MEYRIQQRLPLMTSRVIPVTAVDMMRNEYSAAKLRWGIVLLLQLVALLAAAHGSGLRGPWAAVPAACALVVQSRQRC